MDVNFEYYKIFYYVAKYHNFTKAAQALNNSQPNITRAMNCLEQFQIAEEELADSSGLSHGSVSIGASETALNIFLLDKLKNFHMTYPGIRLKLYNHSTPEAIESVKSGKIDFAVVSTPAEVDPPLKQIMLMPFQEILVGGTTFTALGSQELSLKEVKNYPLISLGRETMTYKFYNSLFLSHGLVFSPDTEAATADQILPLVKCELGLAFLPQPMAAASLLRKEIVQIPLKDKIPMRQVCLVYDSQHPYVDGRKRIAASLFLEFLARNNILYKADQKRVSDGALVAITLMIAESDSREKDIMVNLVMNLLIM